ncbi:MAG: PAS domain S-box protein [Fulvivirga sp.]|nr:PAS domain S-box protein [Fulvivirga sp.]
MQPEYIEEDYFRLMADNMIDLVALHEPDGTYLYVSPSVERILGYERDELIGKNPYQLFHPDDKEYIERESHRQAMNGKDVISVEYRIRKKWHLYLV